MSEKDFVDLDKLDIITSRLDDIDRRLKKVELSEVTTTNQTPEEFRSRSSSDTASRPNNEVNDNGGGATVENRQASQHWYTGPINEYTESAPNIDVQREFECIRDSLNKIKIPPVYKVNDSSQGIDIESLPALEVVSKCARYGETGLKIISQVEGDLETGANSEFITIEKQQIQHLYTVFSAQMNFLQAEYTNIVVRSTFDDETARLFKSFENNSGAFSDRSLQNMRLAAELAYNRRGLQRNGRGRSSWQQSFGSRSQFVSRGRFNNFNQRRNFGRGAYIPPNGFDSESR